MFGSIDHGARAGMLAGAVDVAASEVEGCCASGVEPADDVSADDGPPCCPTGCEHCVRSCCPVGISIVLPAPLPDFTAPEGFRATPTEAFAPGRWSPPSLDRPPRA